MENIVCYTLNQFIFKSQLPTERQILDLASFHQHVMLAVICFADLIITSSKVQKKDAIPTFIFACLYSINCFLAWYIFGKLNYFRQVFHSEISFEGRNLIYPRMDYENDTIKAILETQKMSICCMFFFVFVYAISSIKHIIYNKIAFSSD